MSSRTQRAEPSAGARRWAEEHFGTDSSRRLLFEVATRVDQAGKLDLAHLATIGAMEVVQRGTRAITPQDRLDMVLQMPILGPGIGKDVPDPDRTQLTKDLATMFAGYDSGQRQSAINDLIINDCLHYARYEQGEVRPEAQAQLSDYVTARLAKFHTHYGLVHAAQQRFVSSGTLSAVAERLERWIRANPKRSDSDVSDYTRRALARNPNTPILLALNAAGKIKHPGETDLDVLFERVGSGELIGRPLHTALTQLTNPPHSFARELVELDELRGPNASLSRSVFKAKQLDAVVNALQFLEPRDAKRWRRFAALGIERLMNTQPRSVEARRAVLENRSAQFLRLVPLNNPENCLAIMDSDNAWPATRRNAYEALCFGQIAYGAKERHDPAFKPFDPYEVTPVPVPLAPQQRIAESAAVVRSGLPFEPIRSPIPQFSDFPSAADIPYTGDSRLYRAIVNALLTKPPKGRVQLLPSDRAISDLGQRWGNCLQHEVGYRDDVKAGKSVVFVTDVIHGGEQREVVVVANLDNETVAGKSKPPKLIVSEVEFPRGAIAGSAVRKSVQRILDEIFGPLAAEFPQPWARGSRSRPEPTAGVETTQPLELSHEAKVAERLERVPSTPSQTLVLER